jgi:hypothetical protein
LNYDHLAQYLSPTRLGRYLVATGNSRDKALKLYRINLRAAQGFYPVLNLFEVVCRNAIYDKIASHFSDPAWIITQKSGFMSDSTLRPSKFYLKNCVTKSERAITRTGGTVTPGKIIAEQTFGFWTSLFDTHHFRLIGGVVIGCFPGKPAHENRNSINRKLVSIRKFRNRVYHNEPICFNGRNPDFTNATQVKSDILDLIKWIDPDLEGYLSYFDGIDGKLDRINNL